FVRAVVDALLATRLDDRKRDGEATVEDVEPVRPQSPQRLRHRDVHVARCLELAPHVGGVAARVEPRVLGDARAERRIDAAPGIGAVVLVPLELVDGGELVWQLGTAGRAGRGELLDVDTTTADRVQPGVDLGYAGSTLPRLVRRIGQARRQLSGAAQHVN